jgi:tetratricopeptide (TPR) repeat protein
VTAVRYDQASWTPDGDRAARLCKEALERADAGEREEAERLYREAIALDPEEPNLRVLLGLLLGDVPGRRRAAIREVRRAVDLDPESARALVKLGSLLLQDGRCPEAEPVLLRALDLEPRPGTCVFLGVCVSTLGRLDEGLAYHRQALDIDADYDEAMYNIACRVRFEDSAEAERHLRRAIEIDPVYALAWGELGHVLLVQGRDDEALDALERSVELRPSHWHQLRLAVALLRAGRVADADSHLREALRLRHPDTTREHIECLRSNLATDRGEPSSRLYRAYLLGRRFDFDEALAVLDGSPVSAPLETLRRALLADRALWRVLDEEYDGIEEAIELLERAVEHESAHPEAWEELGWARYGLATRLDETRAPELESVLARAKEALERAISLAPDRPYAHLYLGLTHKRSGRPRQAEVSMRRAVELGPNGVHAAVLGDHLADLGRFDDAEAVLAHAVEDYPESAMAWCNYGRTLMRDGNPREEENLPRAAQAFERVVELRPDGADDHYRLARALSLFDVTMLPRAKTHLERCLALRADHEDAAELLADIDAFLRRWPTDGADRTGDSTP